MKKFIKTIIKRSISYVSLCFLFLMSFSCMVNASEVGAISLFDLMRDYTIVNPMNKVVYGKIRVIETKTDPITDEISVREITIRSNGENFEFFFKSSTIDSNRSC